MLQQNFCFSFVSSSLAYITIPKYKRKTKINGKKKINCNIYIMCACFPVNLTGGWTYTDRALTLAKTELFQPSNGARKGVTKVSSCNVGDTANLN